MSRTSPLTPEQQHLVLKWMGTAEKMARRYWHPGMRGMDRDDMIQCAYTGLIDAARRFDASEVPDDCPTDRYFVAYAKHRIRGQMRDGLRAATHDTRVHRVRMDSLDRPLRNHAADAAGVGNIEAMSDHIADDPYHEDNLTTDITLRQVEARIRREAPDDRSRAIWAAWMAGETLAVIGECEGVSEARICQIVNRALRAAARQDGERIWATDSRGRKQNADHRTASGRVAFWMDRGHTVDGARERSGLIARVDEHQRRRRDRHREQERTRSVTGFDRLRDSLSGGTLPEWMVESVTDSDVNEWRRFVA